MLAINYKNLLTRMYPTLPKIFNLETAAYLLSATVANVSIATFFLPKDTDFVSSSYLVGIPVDNFDTIPTETKGSFKITTPIRTLQDLFAYENLVDPQVTFDYVSWFKHSQDLDPRHYLHPQHHREVQGILQEGWSHGY